MISPRMSVLVAVSAALLASCGDSNAPSQQPSGSQRETSSMQLTSPAFADGQAIPAEFTCEGPGRSPPLQWSGPPAGTQSFALVVEDPDAPKGTFRHWAVYDLPMSARQIDTGAAEKAHALKQTKNDFGTLGYGPPCPPPGDQPHHYHFRLLALDLPQLPQAPSDVQDVLGKTKDHTLGSAELVATYGRR